MTYYWAIVSGFMLVITIVSHGEHGRYKTNLLFLAVALCFLSRSVIKLKKEQTK